jgi:hypothetical protein
VIGQEPACAQAEVTIDADPQAERMWDRRPGWFVKPGGVATGVMDRPSTNTEHIELTLKRLKEKAEPG